MTGPTPSARARRSWSTASIRRHVSCFRPRLGAGEQTPDVRLVPDKHQHSDNEREQGNCADGRAPTRLQGRGRKQRARWPKKCARASPRSATSRRRSGRRARMRRAALPNRLPRPCPRESRARPETAWPRTAPSPAQRAAIGPASPRRDQHGSRPLAAIQQQGGSREAVVARPEHVCRADVA